MKNNWISVENKLPDEKDGRTNYLVLSNGAHEIARINEWGWHYGTRDTQNMVFGVTHWQQLPAPPINEPLAKRGLTSQQQPNR